MSEWLSMIFFIYYYFFLFFRYIASYGFCQGDDDFLIVHNILIG